MITVLNESNPKAKRDMTCDAAPWVLDAIDGGVIFTFSELRAIAKHKKCKFIIKKGDTYIKQNNKMDGNFYTFRAIIDLHDMCIKYNLYHGA